jgi:hypothetical protein
MFFPVQNLLADESISRLIAHLSECVLVTLCSFIYRKAEQMNNVIQYRSY